jgi:hypothetical protein
MNPEEPAAEVPLQEAAAIMVAQIPDRRGVIN